LVQAYILSYQCTAPLILVINDNHYDMTINVDRKTKLFLGSGQQSAGALADMMQRLATTSDAWSRVYGVVNPTSDGTISFIDWSVRILFAFDSGRRSSCNVTGAGGRQFPSLCEAKVDGRETMQTDTQRFFSLRNIHVYCILQQSLADAKVSARQHSVYEMMKKKSTSAN